MTGDRPRAWNSTLPARSAPMDRGSGLSRSRHLPPDGASSVPLKPRTRENRPSGRGGMGEFPRSVKLAVRTRAGRGDIDAAVCECCGVWLGRYGGQIQHVVARGMGGTSNPVLKTAADAALLCGTPQSGDHGRAERRDPEMKAKGFWLPQGTDPRTVPMTLFNGDQVWRDASGGYLFEAPAVAA